MGVFPVEPADVPEHAVAVMKRTLLRKAPMVAADPMDDDLARYIVAMTIAALSEPGPAR